MLYIACAVLWLLRFALGASIFSFLGVVIWRLPRGESVVKGRSHCPACGRTLSAAELVPCLSFLVQGGRCRGCGARIPARDFWLGNLLRRLFQIRRRLRLLRRLRRRDRAGGALVCRARHFNGRGVHGHRHARDL